MLNSRLSAFLLGIVVGGLLVSQAPKIWRLTRPLLVKGVKTGNRLGQGVRQMVHRYVEDIEDAIAEGTAEAALGPGPSAVAPGAEVTVQGDAGAAGDLSPAS